MVGTTNAATGGNILSLNKACVVWLPLNGNTNNYGSSDLVFSNLSGYCSSVYPGIIYAGCYKNFNTATGGLVSDQQILLGNNQSFFCWANFDSFTTNSHLGGSIGGQHRYSANSGLSLGIRSVSTTQGYIGISTGDGTSRTYDTYYGSTPLTVGTWYHLGYTYDGTTIRLYVNGALDGSFNLPNLSVPADYIFTHTWSFAGTTGNGLHTSYNMLGCLNDIRIYNKKLRDSEIQTIYNYRPLQRIQPKQMRYLRFTMNGSSANTSNHICEIEVWDTNGNNLARGKTFTKVSGPSWSNLGRITDGNVATNSYAEAGNGMAEIQLDLGAVYNIGYIIQRNYYSDHRLYYQETVKCSVNGTNWEMLYNSENLNTKNRYRGYALGHAITFE